MGEVVQECRRLLTPLLEVLLAIASNTAIIGKGSFQMEGVEEAVNPHYGVDPASSTPA